MKILVTGVSTGLGNALMNVEQNDYEVFGVSRSPKSNKVFGYEDFDSIPNPDILILNAGMGDLGLNYSQLNHPTFKEVLNVNFINPIVYLSDLSRYSKLINLRQLILVGSRFSSLKYINSIPFNELPGYGYCISKTALYTYAVILRKEKPSFTVNVIHPGFLKSEMGDENGIDVNIAAKGILEKIKMGVFENEHNGVYELETSEVIDF